jgi:hypothetical protein
MSRVVAIIAAKYGDRGNARGERRGERGEGRGTRDEGNRDKFR